MKASTAPRADSSLRGSIVVRSAFRVRHGNPSTCTRSLAVAFPA